MLKSNSEFYKDVYSYWKMGTVRHLKIYEKAKLTTIMQRFPNIETLHCGELEMDRGVFESIHTLECSTFDPKINKNLAFPNLKTFNVDNDGLQPCEEIEWQNFARNIENVEYLRISKGGSLFDAYVNPNNVDIDDSHVLKNIGIFKNLRKLVYRHRICKKKFNGKRGFSRFSQN